MAKTLAQGRKPGSGRKPGKGKTLREGRKPGSGRRRRLDDTQRAERSKGQKVISFRDLEAVDALRELNSTPPQQGQLRQQKGLEPNFVEARPLIPRSQQLSSQTSSGAGAFTLHSVGPYLIPPRYTRTTPGLISPLIVPLRSGGSAAEPAANGANGVLVNGRGSGGDDTKGTVLIHTST